MIYAAFGPKSIRTAVYDDFQYVERMLDSYLHEGDTLLLGGGRHGFDVLAERYATMYNVPFRVVPPNIRRHGEHAFNNRNIQMINEADCSIVFWDGVFRPLQMVIEQSVQFKRQAIVLPI